MPTCPTQVAHPRLACVGGLFGLPLQRSRDGAPDRGRPLSRGPELHDLEGTDSGVEAVNASGQQC